MTEKYECPGCGNSLSSNDKECKYCGRKNPNYKSMDTNAFKDRVSSDFNSFTNTVKTSVDEKKFNVVIFILLLILFWPAALIYALVYNK